MALGEFAVRIHSKDLVPEARRGLDNWVANGKSPTALNELVRMWYQGFGGVVSAAFEPDDPAHGGVVCITLTIPPRVDETHASTAYSEGLAMAERGELSRARECFLAAIRMWPFDHKYQRAWGQSALELGLLAEAEVGFQNAVALEPRDADALTMLGNVYYAIGDLRAAREYHEASLRVEETAVALTNLGAAVGKAGNLEHARKLFERALEIDPHYHKARLGLTASGSAR